MMNIHNLCRNTKWVVFFWMMNPWPHKVGSTWNVQRTITKERFKSGILGNYFAKSMLPKEKLNKIPRGYWPVCSILSRNGLLQHLFSASNKCYSFWNNEWNTEILILNLRINRAGVALWISFYWITKHRLRQSLLSPWGLTASNLGFHDFAHVAPFPALPAGKLEGWAIISFKIFGRINKPPEVSWLRATIWLNLTRQRIRSYFCFYDIYHSLRSLSLLILNIIYWNF